LKRKKEKNFLHFFLIIAEKYFFFSLTIHVEGIFNINFFFLINAKTRATSVHGLGLMGDIGESVCDASSIYCSIIPNLNLNLFSLGKIFYFSLQE
jgi:hypothetical protein